MLRICGFLSAVLTVNTFGCSARSGREPDASVPAGDGMAHCHILAHAELGMMREIVVEP